MTAIDFGTERTYDDANFSTVEVFRSEQMKVVCGYFEPGQFIPVHAPSSDVLIDIRSGTGLVRDGDTEHRVGARDVVARFLHHRPV
nr:hypothetical protein [Halorubrum laminariae]